MNFIVCALLRDGFSEEEAFWMLNATTERWLPHHFESSLIGNMVDCMILGELVQKRLPSLHSRLFAVDVRRDSPNR